MTQETQYKDFHGTPISIGDTVFNFRLNFIEPKEWVVKQREDGLVYCEGEANGEKRYIALESLINSSGVALKVFKNDKTNKL